MEINATGPRQVDKSESKRATNAVQALQLSLNKLIGNSPTDESPDTPQPNPGTGPEPRPTTRFMPMATNVALLVLFGGAFVYNIFDDIARGRIIITDWIYLTHWNLTFQVIFCTCQLVSEFNANFAERTMAFRSKMFHCIVTPYCFFVASFFWTLCFIDETLVRSVDIEERCEEWYNQVVHTTIVPAAILQSMANFHKPSPLIESYTITVVCGVIYLFWSVMWGLVFELWSYELLRVASPPAFMLIVLGSSMYLVILHSIGRNLHNRFWSRST